jgi:hypothetical protein
MDRLLLALRLFFRILASPAIADRAKQLLDEAVPPPPAKPTTAAPRTPVVAPAPTRSDALTLLAVLQREARLIDFLKEEIASYADAQIGAAVRDVHRDAAAALERLFALRPLMDQPEGSDVPLTPAPDAARIKLVGNLGGTPPARGRLQHAGWQATKTDLPQFTGSADSPKVIAPAEVEV